MIKIKLIVLIGICKDGKTQEKHLQLDARDWTDYIYYMILHYAHVNYLNLIINIPKKFVATVTCYSPNDSNPHNHRKVTPQSLVAPTWVSGFWFTRSKFLSSQPHLFLFSSSHYTFCIFLDSSSLFKHTYTTISVSSYLYNFFSLSFPSFWDFFFSRQTFNMFGLLLV